MNRPQQHLSDDQLIALLYSVGTSREEESHVTGCSKCLERWNAMHRALGMVRAESTRAAEISSGRLAAQRRQVVERIAQPSPVSLGWRWVPVATAASLLAAAMFVHQQPSAPATAPAASAVANTEADAELFTDVYSMEQDVEPRAAAPIRALFQEASYEEGQR